MQQREEPRRSCGTSPALWPLWGARWPLWATAHALRPANAWPGFCREKCRKRADRDEHCFCTSETTCHVSVSEVITLRDPMIFVVRLYYVPVSEHVGSKNEGEADNPGWGRKSPRSHPGVSHPGVSHPGVSHPDTEGVVWAEVSGWKQDPRAEMWDPGWLGGSVGVKGWIKSWVQNPGGKSTSGDGKTTGTVKQWAGWSVE